MADFSVFKAKFTGDLITPTDPDYDTVIARWAANTQRPAKIVALVKDPSDVALAIEYAKASSLPIAIRGGGHNPAAASSSKDGLVIDLSRYMNSVKIDADKRLGYVGGGALWETVDREAIKHGLATVGGTVNHTGVAGLTLGGGYGWLSAQHGLALDNVVQATVVTANGSILTASDTENPDLFFGIRGGGSNFGVVTEFVFKLHPQRSTVYAGVLIFAPPSLEKLVSVTSEWWESVGEKEGMLQLTTVAPDGNPAIIVVLFYNGTEAEGRANFKAFFDIGPVADKTHEIPYEEVNGLQNPGLAHGRGVYMKGITHHLPNYQSIAQAHAHAIGITKSDPNPENFSAAVLYEYFPLGKINSVAQDATAFRRDPKTSVLILIFWKVGVSDDDLNTEQARTWAKELAGIINGAQGLKPGESLGYSNYDSEAVTGEKDGVLDRAKLVFAGNYPRLQGIKKKYDPESVFNKWLAITPA